MKIKWKRVKHGVFCIDHIGYVGKNCIVKILDFPIFYRMEFLNYEPSRESNQTISEIKKKAQQLFDEWMKGLER